MFTSKINKTKINITKSKETFFIKIKQKYVKPRIKDNVTNSLCTSCVPIIPKEDGTFIKVIKVRGFFPQFLLFSGKYFFNT